ncbi:hypothetical protein Tco_1230307 [Tanacetum coccineum]
MTRIVAWCLGFMKWVSEDPSYVTGGEPEYPQELFSAVTDVIVVVILIAVVVAIVGVVIVVAIFGNHALLFDPLVCELCWWLPPESEVGCMHSPDKASLVSVTCSKMYSVFLGTLLRGISLGPVFLLGLSVFAMAAACASRAANSKRKILEFKTSRDRYGNNGMCDPTKGLVFSGDEIFLRELGKMFPDEAGK